MNAADVCKALGGRKSGAAYIARCPAHADSTPSLALTDSGDGKLLWTCHAGCTQEAVRDALSARGLLNGHDKERRPEFHIAGIGGPSRVWTYRDVDGREIGKVARYDTSQGKTIRPWIRDGNRWACKSLPEPRPLYGLELLAQRPDAPVLVVEGEKCADAGREMIGSKYVIVTWPGGAKAISKADFGPLRARRVVVWPDADQAGRDAAAAIVGRLRGIAASVRVLDVGERTAGWDAADALAEGWSSDDVLTLIEEHASEPSAAGEQHNGDAGANSRPLYLMHESAATAMLACAYAIKGLIDLLTTVIVYGASGCGKTFFVLDFLLHVAHGMNWRGRRVRKCVVLYIAAEAGAALQRRVRAWLDHHGVDARDGAFWIRQRGISLMDADATDQIAAELGTIDNPDGLPLLIVFDTLSRSLAGGDENRDLPTAIAACDRLRDRLRATVVLVHHSGKDADKGPRGHSSLFAAADTSLCVQEDSGQRVVVIDKARDAVHGSALPFTLRPINLGTDDDGDVISTCVVEHEPDTDKPIGGRTARPLTGGATLVLQAIQVATSEHGIHGGSLTEYGVPADVRAVRAAQARDEHRRVYGERDADSNRGDRARQAAWSRGLDQLQARGLVAASGQFVWQTPAK